MKTNTHIRSYLAQFFLERKMFLTKVIEKLETHILCSITLFRKLYILWDIVAKMLQIVACHRRQYGACVFHVFHSGYLRLQIHTQVVY